MNAPVTAALLALGLAATVCLGQTLPADDSAASRPSATTQPVHDNTLPRYGNPDWETIWDRASPQEREQLPQQSRHAGMRGWQYLRQGDLDTAMKRLNQAWLLHPQNPEALWGMAIVQMERAKAAQPPAVLPLLDEAVDLMEEALADAAPTQQLQTDAAFVLTTRGGYRRFLERDGFEADFERAEQLLDGAEADGIHPQILTRATLAHHRGDEAAAERYEAQARALAQRPPTTKPSS